MAYEVHHKIFKIKAVGRISMETTCKFMYVSPSDKYLPGWGYSLYLDDRDDRLFLGLEIGDLVFFRGCSSEIC